MHADVLVERALARPHAEPVQLSAVLSRRPCGGPLASHRLANGEFRSRHEDRADCRTCAYGSGGEPAASFAVWSDQFVAEHADMGRNPVKPYVPSKARSTPRHLNATNVALGFISSRTIDTSKKIFGLSKLS